MECTTNVRITEIKKELYLDAYKKFENRFKAEYNQLVIRYNGLNRMIENWDKGCLSFKPTCPRSTYDLQLKAMKDYIAVLEARAIMENIDL